MKCNKCGKENPIGQKFCGECGNKLESSSTQSNISNTVNQSPSSSTSNQSTGEFTQHDLAEYTTRDGHLKIPEFDKFGNPYVKIAKNAFWNCHEITRVSIPGSITTIGEHAFGGCINLQAITFEKGVITIEPYAFSGCTGLSSITLPDSTSFIGEYAFWNCKDLEKIHIPQSVTYIDDHAFESCINLNIDHLPEGITYIGKQAFRNVGLTSIYIPDSVTTIGQGAFLGCKTLQRISLPFVGETKDGNENNYFGHIFDSDSIHQGFTRQYREEHGYSFTNKKLSVQIRGGTIIADKAFWKCSNLDVTLPDSIIRIGNAAFANHAENHLSVGIPYNNSIKYIDYNAFYDGGVGAVINLSNIEIIGQAAFRKAYLETVFIGQDLVSIGESAFAECKDLKKIVYSGTMEQWQSIRFGAHWREGVPTSMKVVCSDGTIKYSKDGQIKEKKKIWKFI